MSFPSGSTPSTPLRSSWSWRTTFGTLKMCSPGGTAQSVLRCPPPTATWNAPHCLLLYLLSTTDCGASLRQTGMMFPHHPRWSQFLLRRRSSQPCAPSHWLALYLFEVTCRALLTIWRSNRTRRLHHRRERTSSQNSQQGFCKTSSAPKPSLLRHNLWLSKRKESNWSVRRLTRRRSRWCGKGEGRRRSGHCLPRLQ